jgi:hypothetical protein
MVALSVGREHYFNQAEQHVCSVAHLGHSPTLLTKIAPPVILNVRFAVVQTLMNVNSAKLLIFSSRTLMARHVETIAQHLHTTLTPTYENACTAMRGA